MKKLILSIFVSLFAITAVNAQRTNSITTDTNVQQAIVSILTGVKEVGGEVYTASKTAIGNAVDMVKTQAPDVVSQFLKWKLVEHIVYCSVCVILFLLWTYLIYISYKELEDFIFTALVTAVGLVIIGTPFIINLLVVLEIYVAPKIYIIEYVMSQIKCHN